MIEWMPVIIVGILMWIVGYGLGYCDPAKSFNDRWEECMTEHKLRRIENEKESLEETLKWKDELITSLKKDNESLEQEIREMIGDCK